MSSHAPLLSEMWAKSASSLEAQLEPEPVVPYREWVSIRHPLYEWNWHHEAIADHLQAVADDQLHYLIIEMPPQHGKSELCSRKFPAYYLRKHPTRYFGLVAHTASFAGTLSRAARTNYILDGGELASSGLYSWDTVQGGGFWTGGIDTGVAGRPMHCGLVDDQFKNAVQAMSTVTRAKHIAWWDSVFESRLQEHGALIIVMTRWTEKDLAGTMLRRAEDGEGHPWTILRYEAIRETASVNIAPENCNLRIDLDPRGNDEALWEERFSLNYLKKRRLSMLPYYWQAVYQQKPLETAGLGRVAREFGAHNIREIEDPGDAPLEVGLDFNVEPMWATIGFMAGGQYQIFDEIVLHDTHTDEMSRTIAARYPGRTINVHPDPTGRRRQTSSKGRTDFSIIEEHGLTIVAPLAPWAVDDRINTFNAACMEPDDETPARYFIDPRCRKTIECLNNHTFKPETRDPNKGSGYDHGFDAASYPVMNLLPMADPMKAMNVRPLRLRPRRRRLLR